MTDVAAMLAPLIQQAKSEGKWLWCHYQDLWFSPEQLAEENANGKFLWGPVNWRLRDPQERISEAERRAAQAQRELDAIRRDINRN